MCFCGYSYSEIQGSFPAQTEAIKGGSNKLREFSAYIEMLPHA